jgi:hypothetical protein
MNQAVLLKRVMSLQLVLMAMLLKSVTPKSAAIRYVKELET